MDAEIFAHAATIGGDGLVVGDAVELEQFSQAVEVPIGEANGLLVGQPLVDIIVIGFAALCGALSSDEDEFHIVALGDSGTQLLARLDGGAARTAGHAPEVDDEEATGELGVEIPLHHCSNSAGIVDLPQVNLDLVRAGITLYGLWPSDEVIKENVDLKPLLSLHSKVVYVKEVPAGFAISYGGTYVTDRPSTIATIPVGYGDGYPRGLSNQGYVLIHGQKAPIRGRVCMDQFMVDVTEIADVKTGDEVVLIGTQGGQEMTMEELGDLSGRFNYEFARDLGKRIPRAYVKNGEVVKTRDYFLSWHD